MSAVQRTYAPQGYFGLMLQGIDQSKHFLKVDGTDPFFNKMAVTINPPRDFSGIGLSSAHVALDYGAGSANPKHGEFVFDATHQTQQVWDVYEGLIQQTSFTYTADYSFDPESGWQGEQLEYTLPAVTTENRLLTLDPYDFLGFLALSIAPGGSMRTSSIASKWRFNTPQKADGRARRRSSCIPVRRRKRGSCASPTKTIALTPTRPTATSKTVHS